MLRLAEFLDGDRDHVIDKFALLLSRPGWGGASAWDRGWARLLTNSAEYLDYRSS